MSAGGKRGRKYAEVTPKQLFALAQMQCTIEEAAAGLDLHERTLRRAMAREATLREAWEKGRAVGRLSLRRLQWKHAKGTGSAAVQMTIHLSKHHLGETERVLNEHTGANGGPIAVAALSYDELRERIAGELDSLSSRQRAIEGPRADRADEGAPDPAPMDVARMEGEAEPA